MLLNSDYVAPQQAYLCPFCRGVWMRAKECSDFLGLDCEKLVIASVEASMPLYCAHCGQVCRQAEVPLENGSFVRFNICTGCKSCFLEAVQFALLFYQQIKLERTISGILAQSPLDALGVKCCDCGAEIASLDDLYDANIGYCCKKCHDDPMILSENKIQNVQLVTFHNMEIKVDHWQASSRSRVAVTPREPCLLDMSLYPIHTIDRVLRCSYRKTKFHGFLHRYLDGSESIKKNTPLHVFLMQRGVVSCLEDLVRLGDFSLSFKPQSIVFEITAKRMGLDSKKRFESLVRRTLIAYESFVSLSEMYEMPSDDA